jgi:NAD+ synthase
MLPDILIEKEIERITKFIRKTCKEQQIDKLLVACSGGIDSSVVLTLATEAVGRENIHTLLLPYGTLNPKGVENAKLMLSFLKIPEHAYDIIDIQDMVNTVVAALGILPTQRIRFGNVMARMRMIVLFDQAKQKSALVVGTENRSEYHLGYFTRFGDEASDVEPIRHLYKTYIYHIADYFQLPSEIRNQQPTAGLWENQTDESEFGFSYDEADQVLYLHFDKGLSVAEIEQKGLKNAENILKWASANHFKHTVPYVLEDSIYSLSNRTGIETRSTSDPSRGEA